VAELAGHCLCGAASYEVSAEPVMTFICHCTDCRRQSGAPASLNVVVPRDAFELSGESLRSHKTLSEEDGAERERFFCSECGSPMGVLLGDLPFAVIKAGTLDEQWETEPAMEIWTDSAHRWWESAAGRLQHPRGIPSG
jgi:hypothetical protein